MNISLWEDIASGERNPSRWRTGTSCQTSSASFSPTSRRKRSLLAWYRPCWNAIIPPLQVASLLIATTYSRNWWEARWTTTSMRTPLKNFTACAHKTMRYSPKRSNASTTASPAPSSLTSSNRTSYYACSPPSAWRAPRRETTCRPLGPSNRRWRLSLPAEPLPHIIHYLFHPSPYSLHTHFTSRQKMYNTIEK